jgi:sec-independent protein translocase protein TatA
MPSIGPLEFAVIAIVALMVFGPKRLPELGKSLGSGFRSFKSSVSGEDDHQPELAEAPVVTKPAEPVH